MVRRVSFFIILSLFAVLVLSKSVAANEDYIFDDKDGSFSIRSYDVKGSETGVRYKTVGWTVTKYMTYGNPTSAAFAAFVNPQGQAVGFETHYEPPGAPPGTPIITYYSVPESVVENAVVSAGLYDLVDGQTVRINPIFVVLNSSNTPSNKLHYTLAEILAAENWSPATREKLQNRYDIPVTFRTKEYEAVLLVKLKSAGSTVKETREAIANGKAGTPFTYTLRKEIEDGGKSYQLTRSYVSAVKNPSLVQHPMGPDFLTRNPEIKYGGTLLVAEYDEVLQPEVPPELEIKADFDIMPSSTVEFRDSFSFRSKNFSLPASCDYISHQYRVINYSTGSTWTSKEYKGGSGEVSSFSYSSYPYNISVGSHNVTIKLNATCGDSGWVGGKSLNVLGPAGNRPPEFEVGWTYPGQWTGAGVATTVVEGTHLDLVYLDEPSPHDPDGDYFEFLGFTFEGYQPWASQIPGKYSR